MNVTELPFKLMLEPTAFKSFQATKRIVRRLSDMQAYFRDKDAVDEILANSDRMLYEFLEIEGEENQSLSFGMTTIFPGTIGNEFHMTKGHFHTLEEDGPEIYVTLQGQGKLILLSRAGQEQVLDMEVGSISYILAGWAHRTVNVGQEDLVFLSIWPGQVGHDYASIAERGGFPKLIVPGENGPVAIENSTFSRCEEEV